MLFVSSLQVRLTGGQSIMRKRYLFGSKGCLFRNMGFKSQPAGDLYLQLLSYTEGFINKRWERQNQDWRCNKKPICYFSNMRNISIGWFSLEREKNKPSLLVFNGSVHCCWWRQPTISSPHQFWLWILFWSWSPIFVRNICPQDSKCQTDLRVVPCWLSFGCSLLRKLRTTYFTLITAPYIILSQFFFYHRHHTAMCWWTAHVCWWAFWQSLSLLNQTYESI